MRVFFAFVVLLAGIAAVAGNLAEPRRYKTDMSPIAQGEGRVGSFSTVAAGTETPPIGHIVEAAVKVVAAEQSVAATDVPAFITTQTVAPVSDASPLDAATRAALARDIQFELARLGCYAGPVDGSWSPDTQRAASMFVTEANARIPVSEPDFALFSLTKAATASQSCGPAITVAQTPAIVAPAMGLGGPELGEQTPKAASYRRDRDVEALFTSPLGR